MKVESYLKQKQEAMTFILKLSNKKVKAAIFETEWIHNNLINTPVIPTKIMTNSYQLIKYTQPWLKN